MIVMATTDNVEISMLIDFQGDHAKVDLSAKVSVDAAIPCAVDGQ